MNAVINKIIHVFSITSALMVMGFFVCSIIIHLTNPNINALRQPISFYVHTPNGWIMIMGLLLIAIAEILLGYIFITISEKKLPLNGFLLLFIGFCIVIVAFFPMDIEDRITAHGRLHIYTAGLHFFSFLLSLY